MAGTFDPTDFPSFVGAVYARWTLDALVEIGFAISQDFINRPQLYLGEDIPDGIVRLWISYGTDLKLPNTAQRLAMMLPVFGRSDGFKPDSTNAASSFQQARKKLIDACIAFSERAVDTGIAMLEDRVRSALVPLVSHLQGLQGKSFVLSGDQIGAETFIIYQILQSAGIAQVFGVPQVNAQWPLDSTDPNGAKLVEVAGAALSLAGDYRLTYTRFILLQRVAQEGARALQTILTTPIQNSDLTGLITQTYTWGTSLRDFQQAS